MLRARIASWLEAAVGEAQRQGLLPAMAIPEIPVEYPPSPQYGDYASSLPLRLARAANLPPLAIAERLLPLLPPAPELGAVSVAPPGFINFTLSPAWLAQQVEAILKVGEGFGDSTLGEGKRVLLEFVSANPTGPLHVGHGRGAVLGSTLAQVLQASGYRVDREYYINDTGNQMEAFYRSLYIRYLQALGRAIEMPAEGYLGSYVVDLAREIASELGVMPEPEEAFILRLGRAGVERVLQWIREDLKLLGVDFDTWFSEQSLIQGGQLEQALALFRQGGYVEEREGALWLTATALGESKDNVLVRSSGLPTYFATDIAYHHNKLVERNYDLAINIWGADHQGHVSRMKSAVTALGINAGRLRVLISQMVTLRRGEDVVKVSKRSGELITLRELVEEVGADACRYFFPSRSADSQMDFDLELAKKQSPENPVYYVQYAQARISSLLEKARERGFDLEVGDSRLLTSEPELSLLRPMVRLPEVIETVAVSLEPQHLPYYALELATAFHNFYDRCPVLASSPELAQARLGLARAAQVVLKKTLKLMGMTAPERM